MLEEDFLQTLEKQADSKFQEAVEVYRHIHQYPQIGLEQHNTSKYIREILSKIEGITVHPPLQALPTAIIAQVNVEKPLNSILFRCELDALNFKEESGLAFCSTNNLHHACGHDGHMSAMITAMRIIAENKDKLKKNIKFCFQPGEQGKNGASALIKAMPHLLDGVDYCYAQHLTNFKKVGCLALSKGSITALTSIFTIDITGQSAHSMCPHAGIDANYIGCHLVTQLYSLTHLKIPPLQGSTLNVTKIEGGSNTTSISNNFKIKGSLRVCKIDSFGVMKDQITKLAKNLCEIYGAKCQIHFTGGNYRPVINDDNLTNLTRKQVMSLKGIDIDDNQKSFAGEDFCEFSDRRPSCYISVGSAEQSWFDQNTKQSRFPLHSPVHKLDQRSLVVAVKIWLAIAFQ